jgi:hypothetical protein
VLSVVVAGAVTTRPAPTEPKVTTIVLDPESAVTGLTTTVADGPGPVTVLHVSATVLGVTVSTFCPRATGPTTAASAAIAIQVAAPEKRGLCKVMA